MGISDLLTGCIFFLLGVGLATLRYYIKNKRKDKIGGYINDEKDPMKKEPWSI